MNDIITQLREELTASELARKGLQARLTEEEERLLKSDMEIIALCKEIARVTDQYNGIYRKAVSLAIELAKCEKMYSEKSLKYDEVCLELTEFGEMTGGKEE